MQWIWGKIISNKLQYEVYNQEKFLWQAFPYVRAAALSQTTWDSLLVLRVTVYCV